MNTQPLTKGPAEFRDYAFEFNQKVELASQGQTLTGTPTITVTPTGTASDLVLSSILISGTQVKVWIAGGTAGYTYTLQCVVTTSGGATLEGFGLLQVVSFY